MIGRNRFRNCQQTNQILFSKLTATPWVSTVIFEKHRKRGSSLGAVVRPDTHTNLFAEQITPTMGACQTTIAVQPAVEDKIRFECVLNAQQLSVFRRWVQNENGIYYGPQEFTLNVDQREISQNWQKIQNYSICSKGTMAATLNGYQLTFHRLYDPRYLSLPGN